MNKLYSVCWQITSDCNQNCEFCYRKKCKNLSLEENIKIFNNINKIEIDKLTFTGGEPLLCEYLFELIRYIKKTNPKIKLSITTNGSLINELMINEIIDNFDFISLPIDSVKSFDNEDIGRGKNHIKKILTLLEKLDSNIKIKINTVATKKNKDKINEIYELISKYNIYRWKIFRFYPIKNAKFKKAELSLNEEESLKIKKEKDKLKEKSSFTIQYNDYEEFKTSYFNICPNGSIENNEDEEIGNLLIEEISNILKIKEKELVNHIFRKSL